MSAPRRPTTKQLEALVSLMESRHVLRLELHADGGLVLERNPRAPRPEPEVSAHDKRKAEAEKKREKQAAHDRQKRDLEAFNSGRNPLGEN